MFNPAAASNEELLSELEGRCYQGSYEGNDEKYAEIRKEILIRMEEIRP